MKPRIAVPVPTSFDAEYNRLCWPEYAHAVVQAGGEPIAVPLAASYREVLSILRTCDALLLPGSPADVAPARYGEQAIRECAPPDEPRETTDLLLLESAYAEKKPILGICFGAQILSVWLGGNLVQDLAPFPVNHAAGRSVGVAHTAVVDPGSRLFGVLGKSRPEQAAFPGRGPVASGRELRLPVNSSHHQAVGRVGVGLKVVARCPQDAVIEAFEAQDKAHFVVGLQWHPERSMEAGSASEVILRHFVGASRSFREADLISAGHQAASGQGE